MPSTNNRRGIVAMLAAMCFFNANDTLLKLASASAPPSQLMALRGLFAVGIALAMVAASGQLPDLRRLVARPVVLRAAIEASVAFLFITSLAHLPIANVTAITQATPIIMTVLAVLLGMERVGWRRWSAILIGFSGVLLIVRPSSAEMDVYAVVALAAAILIAIRDLLTRLIAPAVPSTVIALSTTAIVGLAGGLLGFVESWRPLPFRETALIAGAGIFVALGNLAVIIAFRDTDVSAVSPFRYSVILLAILSGLIVFGELPDLWAGVGIALVIASGVYTIHREQAD